MYEKLNGMLASEFVAMMEGKLKRADNGQWEFVQKNVEYISPNQHGGIYGTIYIQYFDTTLSSSLTTGDNVAMLVDWVVRFEIGGNRAIASGYTTAYGTGDSRVQMTLSGASGKGSLTLFADTYAILDGWVDYTK